MKQKGNSVSFAGIKYSVAVAKLASLGRMGKRGISSIIASEDEEAEAAQFRCESARTYPKPPRAPPSASWMSSGAGSSGDVRDGENHAIGAPRKKERIVVKLNRKSQDHLDEWIRQRDEAARIASTQSICRITHSADEVMRKPLRTESLQEQQLLYQNEQRVKRIQAFLSKMDVIKYQFVENEGRIRGLPSNQWPDVAMEIQRQRDHIDARKGSRPPKEHCECRHLEDHWIMCDLCLRHEMIMQRLRV